MRAPALMVEMGGPPLEAEAGGPTRTVVGAELPAGFGMLKPPPAGMVEILGVLTPGLAALGTGATLTLGAGMVEMAGLGAITLGETGLGMLKPPPAGMVEMPGALIPWLEVPGTGATLTLGAGMVEIAGFGPGAGGELGLGIDGPEGGRGRAPPGGGGGGCTPPGGLTPGRCPCGKAGGAGTRWMPCG